MLLCLCRRVCVALPPLSSAMWLADPQGLDLTLRILSACVDPTNPSHGDAVRVRTGTPTRL